MSHPLPRNSHGIAICVIYLGCVCIYMAGKKSNDRVTQNRFCVDELALASIRWVPERPWCVLTLFDSSFDHRVKPCRTRTLEGLLVVKQLSFQVRTPPSFNPEPCISLTLPNSAGRSSAVQDRRPSSWRSLVGVSLRIGLQGNWTTHPTRVR